MNRAAEPVPAQNPERWRQEQAFLHGCQVDVAVGAGPGQDEAALVTAQRGTVGTSGLLQPRGRARPVCGHGQQVDVAVGSGPCKIQPIPPAAHRAGNW